MKLHSENELLCENLFKVMSNFMKDNIFEYKIRHNFAQRLKKRMNLCEE